mmetsp:Transcript_3595/g.12896  ORF Transcript_3595/g.12896 Transcript_3595/m.12896 type:complete len:231 (-) Transcript_3595:9-701(-)
MVRNPLDRFMSAFQEVFQRLQQPMREPSFRAMLPNGTYSWRNPEWLSSTASTIIKYSQEQLEETLQALIHATECGAQYQQSAHLATAASFATMNHLRFQNQKGSQRFPYPVDILMKTETLQEDLAAFLVDLPQDSSGKVRAFNSTRGVPSVKVHRTAKVPACRVLKMNSGHDVTHGMWLHEAGFDRSALRRHVEENKDLLKVICSIYIADYICFGYELPSECVFPGYEFV